jgi:hypothetical protein
MVYGGREHGVRCSSLAMDETHKDREIGKEKEEDGE